MEIIDTHIHLLPGRLGEKVRAFFLERITGDRLAFPADHATVLQMLHHAGIGTAWSLPYAHKGGVAAGLNAASAGIVQQFADSPVTIIGGATVHPHDADTAGIVRQAFEVYGLRVVKLHCSVGNFLADDPALAPMWDYIAEHKMPVVVHTGMAESGHTIASDLAPLEHVAEQFPDARIIIAHCGHPATRQALDLVESHPNVYADLVPVVFEPVDVPPERVEKLAHKLLFGSDAPNTGRSIDQSLEHLFSLGLSREAQTAILSGNARKLMDAMV